MTERRPLTSAVIGLVVSAAALASAADPAASGKSAGATEEKHVGERSARLDKAWKDLSSKLNRPVTLDLKGVTVQDAAREIAKQIDAPIRIDEQSAKEAGVNLAEKSALKVGKASAESAFDQLLKPLSMVVIVDGETLVATTASAAKALLTTRVYPVADLVTPPGGAADYRQLIAHIQQTTAGPWMDTDGRGGSIVPFDTSAVKALTVRQNYQVHREIEQLLHGLREAKAGGQSSTRRKR